MNAYEQKQAARKERLEARAVRLAAAADAQFRKGDLREEASGIPFGQPILVGHHSEGKMRRQIARAHAAMVKGCELHDEAKAVAARAEGVGQGGISSDDPDAPAKIKAKIEALEALAAQYNKWNAQIRKGGAAAMIDAPDDERAKVAESLAKWPYMQRGYYHVENKRAEIRRLKIRLEGLAKAAERQHVELDGPDGCKVVQNVEANRIQILFDGKPDEAVRAKLKGLGFRWAPSEGAWQRHLNNAGVYAAQRFMRGE